MLPVTKTPKAPKIVTPNSFLAWIGKIFLIAIGLLAAYVLIIEFI